MRTGKVFKIILIITFLCQNTAFGVQYGNSALNLPMVSGKAKRIPYAWSTELTESRIVTLISDLNSRGVRPTVHGRDLRDFSNRKSLIRHIQQYTVLKDPEDIRRVLEWKFNITAPRNPGAKADPPLGLSVDTVGKHVEEAADVLYSAIFDQNRFLANLGEKRLNIVLFRRERGGQQLTNLLKTLDNVNVKVIVSGIDDGESWRDAARVFNATGIPTAGKTLLDLAQDHSVRVFLDSRIDDEKELYELITSLESPGPKSQLYSENMNAIYQRGLSIGDTADWVDPDKKIRLMRLAEYLKKFYDLWYNKTNHFSLKNMPLRSMVLVGAAYTYHENGVPQWQKAVDEIGRILNVRKEDRVIFPTEQRQHLVALREDGTVHFSEESLTHYKSESQIVGMWLVKGDEQGFDINSFINKLTNDFSLNFRQLPDEDISILQVTQEMVVSKEAIKSSTRKVPADLVENVAQAISSLSSTQGKDKIRITREAEEAIESADVIVYSNVSLEKNLAPVLIVPGISDSIEKAQSAVKINLGETRRERSTDKNEVLQKLEQIYRFIKNAKAGGKVALNRGVSDYVDYVLDSYLRDEDEDRVYDDFKPVQDQTAGKVSTVAVKSQLDESEIFSTELREAIIALVGIKRAGFKVVDVEKDKSKLVLLKTTTDRQTWAKGQLGLFKGDPEVEDIISEIKHNWPNIRRTGGFVFDVDKTILPKGAKSVTNYTRLAYVFMRLLREGVKVAIISGNSKEEQMSRIVDAIKIQMQHDQSAMENLTFYVSGGATKIGFTATGAEDENRKDIREYNLTHAMNAAEIAIIKAAITEEMKKLSAINFGLDATDLEAFIEKAKANTKKYKNITIVAPWSINNGKVFYVKYYTPKRLIGINKKSESARTKTEIGFPWVEQRGKITADKNEVRYGSFTIKPVPKIDDHNDPRNILINMINANLKRKYKKRMFILLTAGGTSIDITSIRAQKDIALRDFVERISEDNNVNPKENKMNFFYFGDEFFKGGNDEPIEGYLPKGNILAVNDEINKTVTPKATLIGRSPQATMEFLEEILIKPAEVAERMVRSAIIVETNL